LDVFIVPIFLALDAFAVSICIGVFLKKVSRLQSLRVSFSFGFFQFFMPVIGWFAACYFRKYIENIDHWIAFGLLAFIGVNMIREAVKCEKSGEDEISKRGGDPTKGLILFLLAVATSIDAMAAGIAFAVIDVNIWIPAIVAGLSTFLLSLFGILCGGKLGKKFGDRIQIIGGLVLIGMGIKILIEHMFF